MESTTRAQRASLEGGREGEGVGLDGGGKHVGEEKERVAVEALECVGVDGGGPEVDVGAGSEAEEGEGAVEEAEAGVGALELEVDDGVVVEACAEDGGVELEEVVRRAALLN